MFTFMIISTIIGVLFHKKKKKARTQRHPDVFEPEQAVSTNRKRFSKGPLSMDDVLYIGTVAFVRIGKALLILLVTLVELLAVASKALFVSGSAFAKQTLNQRPSK